MFTMGLTNFEQIAIWAVFAVAWLGLGYAVFLRSQILREDKGWSECLFTEAISLHFAFNRYFDSCFVFVCLCSSTIAGGT